MIGPERLREIEPHVAGVAALHVLDTGIVDYAEVCRALAAEIEDGGRRRSASAARCGRARRPRRASSSRRPAGRSRRSASSRARVCTPTRSRAP